MEKRPISESKIKEMQERGIRFYNSVEEQDKDRLKSAVFSTDKEKFERLMHLMKMQITLKKAKITHKSFPK